MTDDTRDRAKTQYASGQTAFERGNYREAVECFEAALDLAKATTPLGGEIQTWLVNAYSAVGRQSDAIALCQALTRHPDLETRKQGKNLLYILQAPQLQRPTNWMTEIPDLDKLSTEGAQSLGQAGYAGTKTTSRPRPKPEEPTIDPSEINRKDNGFLWAALVGVALILGGLLWLS
ncbi:tetratricopeptide repeat protein [Leptolyngbya sp. KIOST-1]|uniref:tetratricopeptide repeat protein n=1 Tax=Leptolyngbya sp. KIOST-1 TaxID=1229172 RepID=UPI00055B5C27|nr:tetratricopeptide repeat protein [Leptolyngbya sp. KIOST-1]